MPQEPLNEFQWDWPSCLIKSWGSSGTQEPSLRLVTAWRVTTWSGGSSATALTWFREWAGGVLLGKPLLPAGERGGGKRSRDARFSTVLLLRPRDWRNQSFSDVLSTTGCQASSRTKQNETRFSTGPPSGEREVHSPSPDKQSPPSLGRPSQGLLHLRLTPGLAGAWTGWASCLQPTPWRCLVEGTGRRPRRWAGWGAATGVEAAGFLRHMMYLIASVCFCAAENCWAKLSTASPVCDTGAFRNCTFSCSFMSARHSQRWCSCTTSVDIAQPRDCVVTFVTRSVRSAS